MGKRGLPRQSPRAGGQRQALRQKPKVLARGGSLKVLKLGGLEASAEDRECFPVVMKSFEKHLNKEFTPATSNQYSTSFKRLFNVDGKSLDAMASDRYLKALRKQRKSYIFHAAATAFKTFFAKRGRGLVKCAGGSKGTGALSSKGGEEDIMRRLQRFMEHLRSEKGQGTAVKYGQALRKLSRLHKKSLDAMESTEYLDAVRKMGMPRTYPAALRAFCVFRGVDVANDAGGAKKIPPKTGGKENASDIVEDLQVFLNHLNSEKGRQTAIQYGQALRKLVKTHRKSLESMASQEYLDRVRKMGWPFKYAAAVRALCKFRSGVALDHGEQLQHANAEAQKRLDTARAKGRPISDGDVLAVLRLWPFAQNTNRKNVMPKGTEWVYSTTVGLIGDRCGRTILSSATVGSEDLVKLLCKWLEDQLGVGLGSDAFPVTSININKGYAAARHRDKNNLGPSAIRALGDCSGGLLRYWPTAAPDVDVAELRHEDAVLMDPKHSMVLFDGNRPHAVMPFEGERYSVVWFTSSRYPRAAAESRTEMRRLGLRWPTAHLLAAARARVADP